MRAALALLVFATLLPVTGHAAELTGSFGLGRIEGTGAVTREVDTSARFQLGGASDLIARLDFGLSSEGEDSATYASAGVGTAFGSIDVGRPRSILEIGPMPDPVRFSASTTRGTFRPLAAEIALDESLGGGVRILAERGPLQLGTSYHSVDANDDGVIGVAGRYELAIGEIADTVTIYGGIESDGSSERYRLGTEVALGRTIAAVDLLRSGDDGADASQVSLGMSVNDSLTLGMSGLVESDGGLSDSVSRIGVGASVALESGTYVRGGIDTRTSDDYAIDLEIGFQF